MSSATILLQLVLVVPLLLAAMAESGGQAKPGCEDKCGNLSIPYPFGTRRGCYLDETFLITCNKSSPEGPKPYLMPGNIIVNNISLDGDLYISNSIARDCYNRSGDETVYSDSKVSHLKFPASDTKNKFTAVGCNTVAFIEGDIGKYSYASGCLSLCESKAYVTNGSCSGVGCCQTAIPTGLTSINVSVSAYIYDNIDVVKFNPCSYAFVVEEGKFNFSSNYLLNMEEKTLPMVLDWAIQNGSCEEAKKSNSYACTQNSNCYDVHHGSAYRCNCSDGYEGNPYLPNGCQDIDECKNIPSLCKGKGKCHNKPGYYNCTCPTFYQMDNTNGCTMNYLIVIKIIIGIAVSVIVLLVCFSWLYFGRKKSKLIKLKEKFFRQNGGLMLLEQLPRSEGANEMTKIFSAEELEKATNNYNESMIIGSGGYGTVYKGILADKRIVAIKKSKIVDQTQIEQFINEVVVLSQINHRNVVKLLGCCLETQVPSLVYEFITNGTLSDHLHNKSKASTISWEIRLRIATETAGVLSYLHSAASTPIIHRDIKPSNILLDDNYTAKVSDFGASRLVPLDHEGFSTLVRGTLGYLDPEYLHTSQLTEKSDVYSFGVVLVELLTGKKPFCSSMPKEKNLSMHFLSSLEEDRLFQVLEDNIVREGNTKQLMEVAKLAKRCLRVKGEKRPTMKEVAMELEGLRIMEKHPWVNADLASEETECLLVEISIHHGDGSSNSITTMYDKQAAFELEECGR